MEEVYYSNDQIKTNKKRAIKNELLEYLPEDVLKDLTDKYFRDNEGNLVDAYTGEVLTQDDIVMDHIIPVSSGGGTALFNNVPCSQIINGATEKWDNNLLEWWKKSDYFDIDRLENLLKYMLDGYNYALDSNLDIKTLTKEEASIDDGDDIDEKNKQNQINEDQKEKVGKHSRAIYLSLLNDMIKELKENGINISNYESNLKEFEEKGLFSKLDDHIKYQKVMYELMNRYVPSLKYKITEEIDYEELIENMALSKIREELKDDKDYTKKIEEQRKRIREININGFRNFKINEPKKLKDEINHFYILRDEKVLKYEIEKRITFLRNKVANKMNISNEALIATIMVMPDLLYKSEDDFDKKYLEKIKDNLVITKDIKFNLLIDFYRNEGRWPKGSEKQYKGENIGIFFKKIKSIHTSLTEDQKEQLLQLDSNVFKNFKQLKINNKFNLLVSFCETNDRLPATTDESTEEEKKLRIFLTSIKTLQKSGKFYISLNKEQLEYLDNSNNPILKSIYIDILNKYLAGIESGRITDYVLPYVNEESKEKEISFKKIRNDNKFKLFVNFCETNNRLPRETKESTEEEKVLCNFLGNITHLGKSGKFIKLLNQEQLKYLDESDNPVLKSIYIDILNKYLMGVESGRITDYVLPYVNEESKEKEISFKKIRNDNKFKLFVNFCETNNRLPRETKESTEEEKVLCKFSYNIKSLKKNGKFHNVLNKKQLEYLYNCSNSVLRSLYEELMSKAYNNNVTDYIEYDKSIRINDDDNKRIVKKVKRIEVPSDMPYIPDMFDNSFDNTKEYRTY